MKVKNMKTGNLMETENAFTVKQWKNNPVHWRPVDDEGKVTMTDAVATKEQEKRQEAAREARNKQKKRR